METAEHHSKTYHSLVLRGKLWTAVRLIMKRETSRVLQPGDRCTKTGDRVMEMPRTKHPDTSTPTSASLYSYPGRTPELTPVDITEDTVKAVAGRLLGGDGPG